MNLTPDAPPRPRGTSAKREPRAKSRVKAWGWGPTPLSNDGAVLLLLLLSALAGLTVACGSKPAVEQVETAASVPVTVVAAKTDALQSVVAVTGTIAPAPGGDLTVTAPETARIAE